VDPDAGADDDLPPGVADAPPPVRLALGPAFTPDPAGDRFRVDGPLGEGGMGVVELVHDRRLGRSVACKRLRPRRPGEDPADHARLERQFRWEAAVTAFLQHPGVAPVYEIGHGPRGEPAFTRQRRDGTDLAALLAGHPAGLAGADLARAVELLRAAAGTLAAAHRAGIVHRDLKPEHVLVGDLGEVTVLDWGLAGLAHRDGHPLATLAPPPTVAGSPWWMAPEQAAGAAPDPRQDVFALGALLNACGCGRPPRASAGGPVAADGLDRLPRGLAALAAACLDPDPARRPADARAVAAELARWIDQGLTAAQRPTAWDRLRAMGRRPTPGQSAAIAAVAVALVAGGVIISEAIRGHRVRQATVDALERRTDLGDPAQVRAALAALDSMGSEADRFRERLATARDILDRQAATATLAGRLAELARTYRVRGPWPEEAGGLRRALADAGIVPGDPAAPARLAGHPLAPALVEALVQLLRAQVVAGDRRDQESVAALIATAADPGLRALGSLLSRSEVGTHDLVFCHCPDADEALRHRHATDLLIGAFGPDPRLEAAARERIARDPAAFWPRVILARAALARDPAAAERHALVALGAEPASLWPRLVLAYAALARGDGASAAQTVAPVLVGNPEHLELAMLHAAGLAMSGATAAAQAAVDAHASHAGHLRWHLAHRDGHPMERSVDALVAAGIRIGDAPARLTPLVAPR
jgi:hypothetical protein